MQDRYYIGLMSGTSLDGIDAVIACFNTKAQDTKVTVIATQFQPYPDDLKETLLSLQSASPNELSDAAKTGNLLAKHYANAVSQLLASAGFTASQITAIGCHGQTIRHTPKLTNNAVGYSIQIGNAALLAELTDIDVVSDFRSRDIAAGGEGAPLVPAFHAACFASTSENRAIINIGGIANITYLPKKNGGNHADGVFGFDSGPGNVLIDSLIKSHLGSDYDDKGNWARSGKLIEPLLDAMLSEHYFDQRPPKSTGRDLFNETWLAPVVNPAYQAADIAHTLTMLTAHSICDALKKHCAATDTIYIHGGGVHNQFLLQQLDSLITQQFGRRIAINSTSQVGISADWVEAVAFAWLAKKCINRETANLPKVTGAAGARILGTISQS